MCLVFLGASSRLCGVSTFRNGIQTPQRRDKAQRKRGGRLWNMESVSARKLEISSAAKVTTTVAAPEIATAKVVATDVG